jgi:hypothetical protein
LAKESPADLVQLTGLRVVETRGIDRLGDALDVELRQPVGVGRDGEEPGARLGGHLVFRAQRNDAGNEKSKR